MSVERVPLGGRPSLPDTRSDVLAGKSAAELLEKIVGYQGHSYAKLIEAYVTARLDERKQATGEDWK